uniref:Uncharacterized protein n=1 Tax=Iridovirus LCIVAC01 TaxID=2506607 RepID=A0A481YPN8_9VIRU|nr:MAG: uncharacterized protein LCIVAC01_00720 [Iridovirus LCIVAC01]
MSTLDDSSLITFKAISNFVSALGSEFGKRQRSLALYCRLIGKTTLSHEKPIYKHIESFRDFCIANREAIIDRDETKLQNHIIKYSKNVFINMDHIFKLDKDNKDVIWNHILTISALVDPSSKAKEILKKNMEARRRNGESGTEEEFLSTIIDKVEAHVDPSANPMQAVAGIMQSGIFTELIGTMSGGLTDGSLDIGKLMGTVQTMVSSIGNMAGGDSEQSPELNQMTSMMTNLTGMMGDMGVESETAIPKIEEIDDEESAQDSKNED